jgi:hypothetical protein
MLEIQNGSLGYIWLDDEANIGMSCPKNKMLVKRGALSIEEMGESFPRVNLYPNPATNQVTIENIEQDAFYVISIVDLSGKEMVRLQSNQNKVEIDVSDLENGIYLVTILADSKNTTLKFIKQ